MGASTIAGVLDSGNGIDWIWSIIWNKRVSDKRKSTLGILPATFQLRKKIRIVSRR